MPGVVRTSNSALKKDPPEIIGLVPAAGKASRLSPLPFSKELYPVTLFPEAAGEEPKPKGVCLHLLRGMQRAGAGKVFIVIRKGKWDIPGYLGDGEHLNLHIAYLMMGVPDGVPYTLDQAFPFSKDAIVTFGFPDIIFQPKDAFSQLLARQSERNSDMVLGLFTADNPRDVDMVDIHPDGRVRDIQIKPMETRLRYTWLMAVWTPVFSSFMHDFVRTGWNGTTEGTEMSRFGQAGELFMGTIIQSAVDRDLRIDSVVFENGKYLDMGSPESIAKAMRFHL